MTHEARAELANLITACLHECDQLEREYYYTDAYAYAIGIKLHLLAMTALLIEPKFQEEGPCLRQQRQ